MHRGLDGAAGAGFVARACLPAGENLRELQAGLRLRVREVPLTAGLALLSGYTGEHPERRIEAAAIAPYPVAADLKLSGVWLSDVPHQVDRLEQAYDFSCGELNSRFPFRAADRIAWEEVNSPSAAERELGPVVI